MDTILDRIVETKQREVAAAKVAVPEAELERRIAHLPPTRDFRAAIRRFAQITLIAEVKKASPSAGVLRADSRSGLHLGAGTASCPSSRHRAGSHARRQLRKGNGTRASAVPANDP